MPDAMHDFVVDFIARRRAGPFYVYYAMSQMRAEMLRTPDSAPDSRDYYTDNIVYMDTLVGKLVGELDRLKSIKAPKNWDASIHGGSRVVIREDHRI